MKYLVSVQEPFFDRITPHSAGQAWIFRIKNIKSHPVSLHQNPSKDLLMGELYIILLQKFQNKAGNFFCGIFKDIMAAVWKTVYLGMRENVSPLL